ncbi:hypothetical protein BV25DRAFT_516773 [Artomyces pyxidatus]|uniref:Uncharacterized protein n=1 Tax=Artomyces pyxidatus TaxID=48021 RepID=A0ACB8TI71_9AGAM|nr:hypothetical protein BV25DRAFT_516773 [Artomyces pyxidatus]
MQFESMIVLASALPLLFRPRPPTSARVLRRRPRCSAARARGRRRNPPKTLYSASRHDASPMPAFSTPLHMRLDASAHASRRACACA